MTDFSKSEPENSVLQQLQPANITKGEFKHFTKIRVSCFKDKCISQNPIIVKVGKNLQGPPFVINEFIKTLFYYLSQERPD